MDQSTSITKTCTKCNVALPFSAFHKAPGGRYGIRSVCIPCAKAQRREYVEEHHEAVLAQGRAWNRAHLEEARASSARYRAAHPGVAAVAWQQYYARNREAMIQRQKDARAADPDAALARDKEYREKHRDARLAQKRQRYAMTPPAERTAQRLAARAKNPQSHAEGEARRRARKANSPVVERLDRRAIIARDNSMCYLCNRPLLPKEVTLDHVIPLAAGGPHTAANLRVACRPCNSRKWKHLRSPERPL